MKLGTKLGIDVGRFTFPLFSQKGAGKSRLQVEAEKRFAVVSTDSQESSQQQGFNFVFQDNSLAEEVVVVDFGSDSKIWRIPRQANRADAHFHSAAGEFTESGFILCEKASRVPA